MFWRYKDRNFLFIFQIIPNNFVFFCSKSWPDSDIDILVILDHSQPVGLKFFGMYEDLKELLGCPVDLVVDRSLAPHARESVERDKILIYERAA